MIQNFNDHWGKESRKTIANRTRMLLQLLYLNAGIAGNLLYQIPDIDGGDSLDLPGLNFCGSLLGKDCRDLHCGDR
ncbi:hypothetical protein HKX48_000873, partial [Thoreauomyces humboldtii]